MNVKIKKILSIILAIFLISALNYKNINYTSAAVTFIETFSSDIYKDASNTTADWEIDTSTAHLLNGKWVHADNTSSPRLYETIPGVGSTYYSQIAADNHGQPIISTVGLGTDNKYCLYFTKWSENIGAGICGGGHQSCWTNLEGTEAGGRNNELCVPDGSIENKQYKLLTFTNGNPAVVVRSNVTASDYRLYYAEWNSIAGWTNVDGVTSGPELMSNTNINIMPDAWKFLIDNYDEPTIFWAENSGSIPNIVVNSFFARGVSGDWKHADRVTDGKEEVINHSITISAGTVIIDFNYDYSGKIYFVCSWSVLTTKAFKFDGTNYQNLTNTNLTLPVTNASNLTTVVGQILTYPKIRISTDNELFVAYTYSNNPYIGKWKDGAWKYVNNSGSGFQSLFLGNHLNIIDFNLDPDNKPIIIMKDFTVIGGHDYTEIYMTRWNGSAWVKADGTTSGFEAMSDLVSGEKIYYTDSYCFDENNYPVASYTDYVSSAWLPVYFSRFTGSDIKGGDKSTNNQDILVNTGEGTGNITRTNVYCDKNTKNIFVAMEPSSGGVRFTKLNNDMYSSTSGVLQSPMIAHSSIPGSKITTATLNAVSNIPSGTTLTYSLSADGGTNWCTATNGVAVDFTTCDGDVSGEDLRWKANVSSTSASLSPNIEYLWINSNGLTDTGTSGQVNITGNIDSTLSYTISSADCNLGVFSSTKIKTCNYNSQISTNGILGYVAYIRADGQLRNGSNNLSDVSGGTISAGTEGYGVSTTEADAVDIGRINDANTDSQYTQDDCIIMDNNTITANATALSTSDKSFAKATAPVALDTVYLCQEAAISSLTPAGTYSQLVTITIVSNF